MMREKAQTGMAQYRPLTVGAGLGSMLGSGVIIGLSATITVWQKGFGLDNMQIGILSGALTFAIAFGSLFAGKISAVFGLNRAFCLLNLFYAAGMAVCVCSTGFGMLLTGVIVTGVASGADLPVSLTVVSRAAQDEGTAARLVSSTQVFWQVGIFLSYICSFVVSAMSGTVGARMVFAILCAISLGTVVWRGKLKQGSGLRQENRLGQAKEAQTAVQELSVKELLDGPDGMKYRGLFLGILVFYVCCNLLANTFGQFQTFTLVQADASQGFATGVGIVLNLLGLLTISFFAAASGGKYRNRLFAAGIVVQCLAMVGMALGAGSLWALVVCIGCYNTGGQFSGEAMYKVWVQESFPVGARTSLQGFINGFSRLCCGFFAFVTPALVMPERIRLTMFGFAVLVAVGGAAGFGVIRLQKKHGIHC